MQSIELVAMFEEEFGIEMDEDAALSVETVGKAIEFITEVCKEQGVDVISGSSRGLAAPKGISEDLFKLLQTAVGKAVNDPEYVATAKKAYVPLAYLDGAQYQALIDRLEKDLRALWAESPWK